MNQHGETSQGKDPMADVLERHYPVTVVLHKIWRQHRQWRYPDWLVSGVIAADHSAQQVVNSGHAGVIGDGKGSVPADYRKHTDQNGDEHFVWQGLRFSLYRDGLTSYFLNLHGSRPSLFVLCRDDNENTGLEPITVSADFSDAEAHMETEGTVLTTPLVTPFDVWIADYILQNKPHLEKQGQQRKKHKRRRAASQR